MPKANRYVGPEDRPLPDTGTVRLKLAKTESKRMKTAYGEKDKFIFKFAVTAYQKREGTKLVWVADKVGSTIDVITGQEYGHEQATFTFLLDAMLPNMAEDFLDVLEGNTDTLIGWAGTGVIKHGVAETTGREYANLTVSAPDDAYLTHFLEKMEELRVDPFDGNPDELQGKNPLNKVVEYQGNETNDGGEDSPFGEDIPVPTRQRMNGRPVTPKMQR